MEAALHHKQLVLRERNDLHDPKPWICQVEELLRGEETVRSAVLVAQDAVATVGGLPVG